MALRVQLPDYPRPGDGTHPVQQQSTPESTSNAARQANDYVGTPRHTTPADNRRISSDAKRAHYHVQSSETVLLTPDPEQPNVADPPLPSKQNNGGGSGVRCTGDVSSVCPRCGRCRCEGCRTRRDLPRRWCGNWECSAESTIDCLTCMCCVRAAFYHCCPDSEEEFDYTDNPCGCCDHPRCPSRWVFIVVLTLMLPCLVLYWPLRAVMTLVTDCYNDCGSGGCRCDQRLPASRPLIEAENCSV